MALFGELVVDLGFITDEQLGEAVQMQKKGRAKLGQIMKQLMLINDDQVKATLAFQGSEKGKGKVFGDCAIELRIVDEKQRLEAVRYQTTSKGVLGDLLIELGFLTKDQRDEVTKQQFMA
ncbi:MAG: hypothetical protein P9X24_19265 [Candidatus Hatepunaea meridiana]|nr:hypothetical protein [Candidatus Hatepunaea meridiana]